MNDDDELPRSSEALMGHARRRRQQRRILAGRTRAARVFSAA
jgi:hypothetical protein